MTNNCCCGNGTELFARCNYCGDDVNDALAITKQEVSSLVKEFSHSFINTNENPLASQVMERMIKFVEDNK